MVRLIDTLMTKHQRIAIEFQFLDGSIDSTEKDSPGMKVLDFNSLMVRLIVVKYWCQLLALLYFNSLMVRLIVIPA